MLSAFGADALEVLGGELEERPELPVLLALVRDAEERAPATDLRLWARRPGPGGRTPVDHLVAGDFPGFEAAVDAIG